MKISQIIEVLNLIKNNIGDAEVEFQSNRHKYYNESIKISDAGIVVFPLIKK